MNRTLALKLPIKPVPYSKTPKVKRLPRWSWQDARPAIDFRWHESTLDANVFLFRKFLRMSELDKMLSLTVYVDCMRFVSLLVILLRLQIKGNKSRVDQGVRLLVCLTKASSKRRA